MLPAPSPPSRSSSELSQSPDRRPLPLEDLLTELVPLRQPGVAVGRPLDRPEDDVLDAVTVDQLAGAGEVARPVQRADVRLAGAGLVVPLDLVAAPAEHRRA